MSNGFQNPVMYTNECLQIAQNNLVLGAQVSRPTQDQFAKEGMKIGDTINVRRPAMMTVQTGASFTAQDYTETSIPLVINSQKHVDTSFTSSDLTLKVQAFSDRVLKPGMIRLAQQIDFDGYVNAANTVANLVGTGVNPAAISELFDIGKKLDDFSTPRSGDRNLALDQLSTSKMVPLATGFFNPQTQISDQYKNGLFSDTSLTIGLDIGMSQNVSRHTVGPLGGSPAVNANTGINVGWANTVSLATKSWTAAAALRLKAGDVFTIAAVNSVNPVTKQDTGQLQQFVVLSDFSSDASGNGSVSISPAIIYGGPFQNVTAQALANALLTVVGTANATYARNIAWNKDAFQLAVVPMIDLAAFGGWGAVKSQNGFSLRVFRQAAISTDTVGNRVDALYGWATVYPERATQYMTA